MQRNNNHFPSSNESVTVSPIIIHRLVEQIKILQKRLEQLERHNVISATQSLANISAAYDISPIPSRLSLLNMITKQNAAGEISDPDMLTVRDRQPSASSSMSEKPTIENVHHSDFHPAKTLSKEESQRLMEALSRLEYVDINSETSTAKEQEIQTGDESEMTSYEYESNELEEKIDLSEDQWLSGGGSQTPSLSYSISTDTISVDDRLASQIFAVNVSSPIISIEQNPQTFFRPLSQHLQEQELPNVPFVDIPFRPSLPSALEDRELESPHSDIPVSDDLNISQPEGSVNYGRCYSSFFPTTLLGSPITVHRSSARHSLAKSMTELTPMLKQSGSCLNLQDRIHVDNNSTVFSEAKSMSEGKDVSFPQLSSVSRMRRWLRNKMTGPHKVKRSQSAPVLNTRMKTSFSIKFSKPNNMH
ncbi:hypothetical protein NQZ79_g97 [Umbelopsis isabellina]|nr:hypothetical protein NQZ79_g97 [Umbelopsis isabellina]